MPLFWTEFVGICCSDPEAEKRWWISSFACQECPVPEDWDDSLASDVALCLPGNEAPTILLRDRRHVLAFGGSVEDERALVFCSHIRKARGFLQERGVPMGPTQAVGGAEFFEIRDPEGREIEIRTEP